MKECQAVIIFHCLRSGILSVKIQLTLRGDFILKYVTRSKKQSKVESVDTYDTSTNTTLHILWICTLYVFVPVNMEIRQQLSRQYEHVWV